MWRAGDGRVAFVCANPAGLVGMSIGYGFSVYLISSYHNIIILKYCHIIMF